MQRFVLIAAVIVAAGSAVLTRSDEVARLAKVARAVREVQTAIPAEYWSRARCVAVFPEVKTSDFVVGGKYAKGVMSCRAADRWTAPAFIELGKGRRMFQLGAEQMDIVLLLMNEAPLQKMLRQTVTLGADASLAPGPIDTQARVDPATLSADILTYSRAKGLFMNFAGGVIRADGDANKAIYGDGASLRTILATRDLSAPTEADAFIAALNNQAALNASSSAAGRSVAQPAAATAGSPRPREETSPTTTTPVVGDDSLRARVADLQQLLDRMLADADATPVGTTGTPSRANGTVTVDRARLLQLRARLDALMAELNRR
jgi:SH3 domain-containing YSC84-like protein 1